MSRRVRRTGHIRLLSAGSTLLLHTDGLIETRTHTIGDGTSALHGLVSTLAGTPVPELLDTILREIPATDHEGDIAVIAIRLPAQTFTGEKWRRHEGADS